MGREKLSRTKSAQGRLALGARAHQILAEVGSDGGHEAVQACHRAEVSVPRSLELGDSSRPTSPKSLEDSYILHFVELELAIDKETDL